MADKPRSADRRATGLRLRLRRLSLLVLLGVIVATAVGASGFVRLDGDSRAIIDELSPIRIAAADLTAAYLDQETGVRGFLLSRERDFLQPYTAGRDKQDVDTRTLRNLLANRPALRARLDQALSAGSLWQQRFAEPAIASVGTRSPEPSSAVGKAAFDNLRTALTTFDKELASARAAARGQVFAALRRLEVLGSLIIGALLVLGGLLWRSLRRLVIDPLSTLAEDVQHVSGGDFGRELHGTGPAEITALATDIDSMRSRIVTAYEDAVQARERLDEQASNLAAQAEDLRRSNEELEQFAYVASHDLQEPLRKVASFCQLLEHRYAGQLDERADQYIGFAVDGAKRMQQLINDLLRFSRVGRIGVARDAVDLNVALADALANLDTLRAETGAEVDSDTLPTVVGDRTLLTQLFQNVIGNALKFRDSQEPPRVQVSVSRESDYWRINCTDNGIGIEPQYAERIFVIFQRLHAKEVYGGTGIGLALCRKIVDYHGGRIWVDTTMQHGTRICWTLPVGGKAIMNDNDKAAAMTQEGGNRV